MKVNCKPEIYLNRSAQEYIDILVAASIMFCARAPGDQQEEYGITPFTCSELLKFIDKNLTSKLLFLELN